MVLSQDACLLYILYFYFYTYINIVLIIYTQKITIMGSSSSSGNTTTSGSSNTTSYANHACSSSNAYSRQALQNLYSLLVTSAKKKTRPDGLYVASVKEAIKQVPLEELGILPVQQKRPEQKNIRYVHMYEDDNVSVGIFCLPARSRIPLHNHPGMTVVSRVLYGDLHVRSFDWVDRDAKLAASVCDGVIRGHDDPIALMPASGGNLHQFTALTDCAVLDILSPPYSTEEGRDCSYYRIERVFPDGRAVLEEYEPPSEFFVETVPYNGTPLVATL